MQESSSKIFTTDNATTLSCFRAFVSRRGGSAAAAARARVKGRNPFRHEEGRSGPVTRDHVISKNPDLYSVSWCGTAWKEYMYDERSVMDRYPNSGTKFVQDPNRIFKLWEGKIGHPSLRLLDGRVLDQRKRLGI